MSDHLYIGLMSGTSVDGVDAALLKIEETQLELIAHHSESMPRDLQSSIQAISQTGDNEIERLGVLDRQLGRLFANAAQALLNQQGLSADAITAIGSHGQTIRHRPPTAQPGAEAFTLQVADPNTIAEHTGITTVADFRRRDIAAGGEGAPLAPAFHHAMFRADHCDRAIVNIGGIANVTLLNNDPTSGFDTGPGNTLMDGWCRRHLAQEFDYDGRWAATGQVQQEILAGLLNHPYLSTPTPKSTGKEIFNLELLEAFPLDNYQAQDIQATLAEFTIQTIANALPQAIEEIYLCGGGAHNGYLRSRLQLQLPGRKIAATDSLGVPPDWVEAAAFAWLAAQTLDGRVGNMSSVTGAAGERVLGAIYAA